MDDDKNEALREAACVGDLRQLDKLLGQNADVNSVNAVNGWTALHWACKRGHVTLVGNLLKCGADKSIRNNKNESPADLTTNNQIRELLGEPPLSDVDKKEDVVKTQFTPNYISNPPFIYARNTQNDSGSSMGGPNIAEKGFLYKPSQIKSTVGDQWSPCGLVIDPDVIVLRVRASCANHSDDFTELEINRHCAPTLNELIQLCCDHLGNDIQIDHVKNIRKLPNTILKNDSDVIRLTDYQALELILYPHLKNAMEGIASAGSGISAEHAEAKYMKNEVAKLVF